MPMPHSRLIIWPVDTGFVYIVNNIQVVFAVKMGIIKLYRSLTFIK